MEVFAISIYRDFFKILDNPLNIQVVNFIKRMETEEEMNERLKKLGEEYQHVMQNEKNKKGKNRNSKNLQNEILKKKMNMKKRRKQLLMKMKKKKN